MSKRAIDRLIASADNSRKAFASRYPAKIVKAVQDDLRAVRKAKEAGSPVPSAERICEFFQETYKVKVAPSTVRKWLQSGGIS